MPITHKQGRREVEREIRALNTLAQHTSVSELKYKTISIRCYFFGVQKLYEVFVKKLSK